MVDNKSLIQINEKIKMRDPGRQYKIISGKTKQMATSFFFFLSSLLG